MNLFSKERGKGYGKRLVIVFIIIFALVTAFHNFWIFSIVQADPGYTNPSIGMAVTSVIGTYTNVSPEEVNLTLAAEDVFLLDVRTPDEYESGHIPCAYLIPVTELDDRESELPVNLSYPIIVYCRSGGRSVTASEKLASWGYLDVRNMLGGFDEWKRMGFPAETGPFKVCTTTITASTSSSSSTSSNTSPVTTDNTSSLPSWIFTGLILLGLVRYRNRVKLTRKK